LASLPPLVNTTSVGCALTATATCCRASSTARRAARPYSWRLEALPRQHCPQHRRIERRRGVVVEI